MPDIIRYGVRYTESDQRRQRKRKIKRILAFSFTGTLIGILISFGIEYGTYAILKSEGFGPDGVIEGTWAYDYFENNIVFDDSWVACKFYHFYFIPKKILKVLFRQV